MLKKCVFFRACGGLILWTDGIEAGNPGSRRDTQRKYQNDKQRAALQLTAARAELMGKVNSVGVLSADGAKTGR